jgi:metal-responsive CopG/Arc/MetJ family transcriptional regulator
MFNICYSGYTIQKEGFILVVDKSKNKQVLVTFPLEQLEEIEDYWHEKRYSNRNEAIRALIKEGLKHRNKTDESR